MTRGSAPAVKSRFSAPVRLCLIVIGGFLYGLLAFHLPRPQRGGPIWLGNVAAPWVLIPFLAGAWRFRARTACVAGALGAAAAAAGFYNVVEWVARHEAGRWFSTFVLGDHGSFS